MAKSYDSVREWQSAVTVSGNGFSQDCVSLTSYVGIQWCVPFPAPFNLFGPTKSLQQLETYTVHLVAVTLLCIGNSGLC